MKNIIEGKYHAEGLKMGVVASRFNELIVQKLITGSEDCFYRHGGQSNDCDLMWVPGSFEIPLAAQKLAKSKRYDFIVCLGAVIRGSTPHFDYVASEVSKGIAQVGLETEVPVIFGVLTTDTIEQAIERSGTKAGNKGWEAALNGIEMANLVKTFDGGY